jgi:glycosyltransferase involved in cell wall biosynthesis
MKILQVTPRYHPSIGGVEETVKQYSERLTKDFDHQVTVLTSNLDSDGTSVVNGVKVERSFSLPFAKKGPFLPITPLIGWSLLSSRYDLWHMHANKRFTTDFAAVLQKIKKTPTVFSPYAGMFGTTWLGRVHNRTIGRLAFDARVTIVISKFEKNLIEKEKMPVKRFEVLPIGIDVSEFGKADLTVKDKWGLKDKKVILFVGRLTKHKGVDTLLRAAPQVFKKNPEARILVVGPDFGEKETFRQLARDLQIEEQVIFGGSVSREQLLGCYKIADVFCLPSRSEAFGIVLIEAMAAGVPVVGAANTAIPEIIQDGETGLLFPTEDEHVLAEKINLLLEDEKLHQELVNNAAVSVAEKYNWDQIVSQLDRIYKEVVGS